MLMGRFPQGSGYNFACQRVICFGTFSLQQLRWGTADTTTNAPLGRVDQYPFGQPTHAVRVTVTETYFASCSANFRSSIVTF